MAKQVQTTSTSAPNGWPRQLLEGFRAGERQALATVYEQHAHEVAALLRNGFNFQAAGSARRFAGYSSAFDLQDALHSTFLAAFEPKARMGYDGIRPYGPYLRTIARNLVLKRFREREELFPSPSPGQPDDPIGELPAPGPSPEQQVADKQMDGLVELFLRQLSPADRLLLEVRFVEQIPQREAASRLGLTRQRLRSRETRLRSRFLRFLRAQDRGPRATPLPLWALMLSTLVLRVP